MDEQFQDILYNLTQDETHINALVEIMRHMETGCEAPDNPEILPLIRGLIYYLSNVAADLANHIEELDLWLIRAKTIENDL